MFLHAIAFIVVALSLWIFDPVDVATNSENATISLLYRLVAPQYPPPAETKADYADPFEQTHKILVVVVNDQTLRRVRIDPRTGTVCIAKHEGDRSGEFCPRAKDKAVEGPGFSTPELETVSWPAPLSVHAAILEKILGTAQPRALFIDFGFFDDRDPRETERLREVLCQYAKAPPATFPASIANSRAREVPCPSWLGNVPILLPDLGPNAPSGLRALPKLTGAATALVSTRYVGEDRETFNQYPRIDCKAEMLTPAFAMHLFGQTAFKLDEQACGDGNPGLPISVFWATWGNADSGRGIYGCRTLPETSLGRAGALLSETWADARNNLGGLASALGFDWAGDAEPVELRQTCPPQYTIAAHDLLLDEEGLELALDDAFVLYGGNFAMADDFIRPPTHNPIPAVYWHAMELDNLERGEARGERIGLEIWLTLGAIFFTAFCHAFLINGRLAIREILAARGVDSFWIRPAASILWILIVGGAFVLFLGAITWYTFFVAHTPPIDFVGIVLLGSFGQIQDIVKVNLASLWTWFVAWYRKTGKAALRRNWAGIRAWYGAKLGSGPD